jgi:hypothetical protein
VLLAQRLRVAIAHLASRWPARGNRWRHRQKISAPRPLSLAFRKTNFASISPGSTSVQEYIAVRGGSAVGAQKHHADVFMRECIILKVGVTGQCYLPRPHMLILELRAKNPDTIASILAVFLPHSTMAKPLGTLTPWPDKARYISPHEAFLPPTSGTSSRLSASNQRI